MTQQVKPAPSAVQWVPEGCAWISTRNGPGSSTPASANAARPAMRWVDA